MLSLVRCPLSLRCRVSAVGVGLALAGSLASSSAWAWGNLLLIDARPAQDTLAVGASAWAVPRSPGSRQQTTLLLPALDLERHDGWFVSTDLGVGQNLSGTRDVQAGWRLWPQFGRSAKDAAPGLPAFGPRLLKQGFANVQVTEWLLAQSTLSIGSGRAHRGASAELGLTTGVPIAGDLLGLGVAATLANRAHRQDEVGATASGWSDRSLTLSFEHRFDSHWRVDAQAQWATLLGGGAPTWPSGGWQRQQRLLTFSLWRDL